LGGPGSGYGTKRPDHSKNSGRNSVEHNTPHIKHLKSIFSDLPDPSVHKHKLERDRNNGKKDYEMSAERRQTAGLTYKEMQAIALKHAEEMMQVLLDVASDAHQPASARVSAANSWLDRGFGKAATLNYNINAGAGAKPAELSDDDLTRRIQDNLKALEKGKKSETIDGNAKVINIRDFN